MFGKGYNFIKVVLDKLQIRQVYKPLITIIFNIEDIKMKTSYIIGIIAVVLLLALAGCQNAGEVVEEEVSGAATAEEAGGAENEEVDVKELIKELSEEAGLDAEEAEEETTAAVSSMEVVIVNFRGSPEDFEVEAGATVKFTNDMGNFVQRIIILRQKEFSNKFETRPVNSDDLVDLMPGESYEYTFEEAGTFKWGSQTRFDKINGIVTVTE